MANIFIGGAWPYANGSLHLGRLASILPGDILARYHRAAGDEVLYVSGSDCHGTPVAVQAAKEGVSPGEFAGRYHQEFVECFSRLGFTYDLYTRTDLPDHHRVVQKLFLRLLDQGYLYTRSTLQCYCEHDQRFLPDRYVEGICPHCGQPARGDQCDHCSALLDPADLLERVCKICGTLLSCVPPSIIILHYRSCRMSWLLTRVPESAGGRMQFGLQSGTCRKDFRTVQQPAIWIGA